MSSMSFVISRPKVARNASAARIPVRINGSGAVWNTDTPAKRNSEPTRYAMTTFPAAPRAFSDAS